MLAGGVLASMRLSVFLKSIGARSAPGANTRPSVTVMPSLCKVLIVMSRLPSAGAVGNDTRNLVTRTLLLSWLMKRAWNDS
jgi:hypothetical protein